MAPKTKEYTRRAIDKYRENKDVIYLTLEKGTKEKIETMTGEKAGAFIRKIVMEKIKDLENGPEPAADQETKQETAEPAPKQEEPKPQAGIYNPPTYDETEAERIKRERAEIDLYGRFRDY